MNRYKKMFKKLNFYKEGCFVPFVVIGDPSLKKSVKIIETLISYGADAIEIGIPFSDPLADGPIIQKANIRALNEKNTLSSYFYTLKNIRKKYINIPIGILTYANLIYNAGISTFYEICYDSGIDSVLIADVPIEESNVFYNAANQYNIDSIFICPPDVQNSVLLKIINYSKGYIYLLSRPGVTGIENQNILINVNIINKIKNKSNIPILQGFGISNTSQIKEIISSGVSGVICGSVIIDIIEKNFNSEIDMIEKIKNMSMLLKESTKMIY